MLKRGLVIGILILFIGSGVLPVTGILINSTALKKQKSDFEETFIINSQGDDIDWWPQHQHGPQNTGYSTSKAPNTNNVLWKLKLPKSRAILSDPIVADNRVYVCGAGEDLSLKAMYPFIKDRDFGGKLYCIDAITGGLLWMMDYPLEDELPHNIIEGTPVVYDNKVYVCPYSIDNFKGKVHCFDAINGDMLWKSDYIGRLEWGGPTVIDEKLYVASSYGIHESKIDCLNANNGELLWSYSDRQLNGCPVVFDDKVYIGKRGMTFWENDYNVCCLNASTGELVWRWYNPLEQGSVTSPLVVDDKLFIGSEGYGETSPDGSEYFPGEIFCINAVTGKTIWVSDIDEDFLACFAYYNGKIFAGSNAFMDPYHPFRGSGYVLYCLDADSGEVIWEKFLPTLPGIMNPPGLSSSIAADGKVFVCSPCRRVCKYYCFDALSGEVIWDYKVLGRLTLCTGAAIADGQVYFPFSTMSCRSGKLYCFGDVDSNAPSAPSISGKKIGATEKEYEYTFRSTDSDGDDVYYYISWGDGTIDEWIGPFNSGEEVKAYHTWSEKGLYEIKVRAKDDEGLRGSIGIKKIYMFKNISFNFLLDLINCL
jgi:outer membrane protein assembly factor BamB